MKHDAKRRRLVIALMLATVLLVTIGSAFAYFTSILNNDRAEKMTLKTGTMALVFEDNDKGINKSLAFGETVTKKFTIENTGTLDASLSLDFLKLQNSYLHRSLSYNLTYSETEDGEYKELVPETNMPVSNIPITSAISGEISVPAGEKYYYNLNITLNDLPDKDQTVDLDASFSTEFTVNTPSRYRYYTLRVDPNGGVWKTYTGPQEYLLKSDEEMVIEDPTRYGYDFGGWKIIGASSEIDGTNFYMGITDTYLSARWNPHKVRVTIDGISREVDFGSTLDLGIPEKEGYTFTGWTSTGGVLENESLYVDEDEAIVVTSNYAINNYKYIVYHNKMNIDGETYTTVGEDTEEDEAEYGSTVNPKVKTYTGFTSPEAKSLKIQAESVYPPVLNRRDYNYTRNKYTLTTNVDGIETNEEVFYDATRDLGIPEKTGYNFTNWTVEGAVIEGNEITMGTNPVSATANFTPATYSVTFNPNGGTTPLTSMTVTYDSEYGELPIPTYDGYRFLGWFTDRTEGEEVTSDTKVSITSNVTLFAHFEEINVLMARVDNEKIWNHKEDITKVVFEPQILSKENAAYTYDVSSKQNKSVMSYLVPTQEDSSKYTLYIQADGKIIANPDSSGLFAWFENLRNIEGLENFETSNVVNMSDMFDRCYSLESLDLSSFDTSNVDNMGHMFNDCRSLTSLIIKNFDTRNVQYMDYMFSGNVNLESLDVSSFDTSNVVNMERMFAMWIGDYAVYGKLSELKGLENFKTQNVTNMSRMFDRCNKLVNLNLSSFDTGNVTDMGGMFGECHSLSALDLKTFDTSKVFTMEYMFDQCYSLTSLDLSSFDTKNVTTMKKMFGECRSLPNLNLRSFDTSKVNDMSGMFFGCNNATSIDLSSFDTRSVIYMGSMFSWCWSLTALDLNHFNTSNVVDMNSMFQTCWSLTTLNLSSFDTSNVVNMANMFDMWSNDDAFPSKLETIIFSEKFNTSKVTSMDSMFSNCNSLKSLDLSSFDTSNVTNMGGIFANCSTLEKLDLSNFDTRNVTNMAMMFCMWHPAGSYDSKLSSITFSQKFDTKNVTDMSTMFYNIKVTSLDLSSFDTSNVTSMYHMFAWCRNLTSLGLSNFDTSNVDNMEELVAGCASLTSLNLENFNTSKVTSMYRMFTECTNLTSLNIKNFDISSVTEKDEFINSVPSNIKVTVGNTNLKQWVIDASNDPKLTDANFLIG